MKLKDGFKLRTVLNQPVLVAEGIEQVNFNKMITFNASAAYLWESVEDKDFTVGDLASALMRKYGIDEATATADAKEILAKWIETGLVDA